MSIERRRFAVAHATQEIIDVISDFHYDSQNTQYNNDNRQWRKNTKAAYIYAYTGNPLENVYVDGHGLSKRTVHASETKALTSVSELLGIALLAYLICEVLIGSVLVWGLRKLGVNVHLDFLSFSMGGSQWGVTIVRICAALLKYSVAFLILQRCFRLPFRLRVPLHPGGLPEYIAAIGAAMGIAAVSTIIEVFTGHGAETARQIFDYKNAAAVITYAFFDIIFLSILSELLLRGFMMPVLRQFGDRFAVYATAIIAFLFPNHAAVRFGEFCIAMAAGYLLIKSGSLEKCILLRMIYSALGYGRLVLLYSDVSRISVSRFLLILILSAFSSTSLYLLTRAKRRRLSNRTSYLTSGQKTLIFSETVTMLSWICISVLLMLVQFFC